MSGGKQCICGSNSTPDAKGNACQCSVFDQSLRVGTIRVLITLFNHATRNQCYDGIRAIL